MNPVKAIPPMYKGEYLPNYVKRLRRAGIMPREVLTPEQLEHLETQEREHKRQLKVELELEHKCSHCFANGAVYNSEKKEWVTCPKCNGSMLQTVQEDDLAPVEINFRDYLKDKGVKSNKLIPEFVHRIYWLCQYLNIEDFEKMHLIFLSRVRVIRNDIDTVKVFCDAPPAWESEEKKNNANKTAESREEARAERDIWK